ncbi:MAG TPA: hypothetical protein VFZ65_07815 [Planctomycetota bacterium]|nr:hypothetical protein [Planctomycetota bacterium]
MTPPPVMRLIALGASNLTRLCLAVLDAAREQAQGPVEAHLALGRGRSFGVKSRLLGRELPGIDGCGLWRALGDCPELPTTAFVTDVGNDVLYGVEVPRILAWVESALQRLSRHTDRVVVAGLPMGTLRPLSAWRFAFVRSLLVPGCRLTLAQTLDAAERLHAGLARLAERHGATFCEPEPSWYGFDPVHIRRRCAGAAVRRWLGMTPAGGTMPPLDGTLARLRLLFARPHERAWFGVARRHAQPARCFADGTTLSLW